METKTILEKLASREPVFTTLPPINRKIILGTESEYGACDENGNPVVNFSGLPLILGNGGMLYQDCKHLEYASPETSNPASAVAYYEAGKVICWQKRNTDWKEAGMRLYCNNNTWQPSPESCNNESGPSTFGSHENYFTRAKRSEWPKLIPFLVARTVFTGNGWLNCENQFELSQRASKIVSAASLETTFDRGIINLRPESLSNVKGWDRLHLIVGDATMSEVSAFLRLGTTGLMVEMLELGALPKIRFDESQAPANLHAVSKRLEGWYLNCVKSGPKGVLELLALYQKRAEELSAGRDLVTDAVLVIWKDTLERLGKNPRSLCQRLDWAAKLNLLETFMEKEPNWNYSWLRSLDMEYHSVDPERGLYYGLRQSGLIERVVSDELINHAAQEPPPDTRANIRGKVSQYLSAQGGKQKLAQDSWSELAIVGRDIGNPFNPYQHLADWIKGKNLTENSAGAL